MNAYREPEELKKLFRTIHFFLYGSAKVETYPSEKQAFISAFARGANEIGAVVDAGGPADAYFSVVSRLTRAVARAYAGGRPTAFWMADHLLTLAGFQLPLDDVDLATKNMDVIFQMPLDTEIEEGLRRYWK